jgi:hypothetical protein
VKIDDETIRCFELKMKPIELYTFFNIEKELFKWNIIFIFKIFRELFGFEDEILLDEVDEYGEPNVNCNAYNNPICHGLNLAK